MKENNTLKFILVTVIASVLVTLANSYVKKKLEKQNCNCNKI